MSSNNRNISEDTNSRKGEGEGVSGLGKGTQTGPVAGGADNTRGENKPSSGGANTGKNSGNQGRRRDEITPQDPNANLTTTSRGADSTDKEFRNDQPNASTLKGHKSSSGLGDKEER